jgi:hypothetical protein
MTVSELGQRLAALGFEDPLDAMYRMAADLKDRIAIAEQTGTTKELAELRKLQKKAVQNLQAFGRALP